MKGGFMFKKFLATVLSASLIMGLCACSGASSETAAGSAPAADGSAVEAAGDTAGEEKVTETAAAETEKEEESAESAEPVTLRMAWWGSQTRHDITVAAIELYEQEHPNVTIEYEFFDFDNYFTKLKTLVASDQVWDIFQLGGNFPEYIDKICYMNEFIDSGLIDVSDIPETYLKITQDTAGNQIGLSNGLNTYGIAYDVDMFNEAGVPLPAENWTWDDYKDAALKISEATGHFGSSGLASSEFIAGCSTYIGQQGSVGQYGFFNLDLTGMGFEDAQMLTPYIQMRADLIKAGASPDAGAEMEITNIENDFLVTGEAGMTWVAVNQFPTIYDICKEEGRTLALATIPRVKPDGPAGAVIQSSQMLCVSKDSQYKEEAAKFIAWFQTSVECNKILNGERGIPVADSVRAALEENLTEGQQIMYDYVSLVGTFETPEKVNVLSPDGQDQVVDNYRNYIQQVVSGEITAEEAADKTYADAKAIFQ
ncbi:MAG: extracellular solute-binding protein [Lachnospiraceae bacterium]|nr:extracellular solute-binding protein [Lachnospiraceae bacterium]